MTAPRFAEALNGQIAAEFAASHQYVAAAAYYESQTLPQLAGFFYSQAVEERGHALMMIKYLLDTDAPVTLGAIEAPRIEFGDFIDPIRMALEQERSVSAAIAALFKTAREEGDFLSEQFMQWFLKEQVEEEATASELLDIAERVGDQPMVLEEYIARENPGAAGEDPTAPEPAGGVGP